jgi:hypothetical protein
VIEVSDYFETDEMRSRVPNHASIFDANVSNETVVDLAELPNALIKTLLSSEHGSICLHGLLHSQSQFSSWLWSVAVPNVIEIFDSFEPCIFGDSFVRLALLCMILNVECACSSKDHNVQQGVGTEAIGTVDGNTCGFSSRVEAGNDDIFPILELMLAIIHFCR